MDTAAVPEPVDAGAKVHGGTWTPGGSDRMAEVARESATVVIVGAGPSGLPQQILVQRLISSYLEVGGDLRTGAADVDLHDLRGDRPRVTYTDAAACRTRSPAITSPAATGTTG